MHHVPLSSLMLEHLQELLNSAGGHPQTLLLKWLNFFFTHFKRHIYILSVWVNNRARREIEVVRKKPQSILIPRGQSDSGQVPLPMSQHWGNISLLWGWRVSWNPVVFYSSTLACKKQVHRVFSSCTTDLKALLSAIYLPFWFACWLSMILIEI